MLQLHSFSRSILVFLTGADGHCGSCWRALLLLNRPFGFVALARSDRSDGDDHAQFRDPDRPDRTRPLARGAQPGTPSSKPAVRRFRPIILTAAAAVLGDDSALAQRVLGSYGGGDHGRVDRRHRVDVVGPASRSMRRGIGVKPPGADVGVSRCRPLECRAERCPGTENGVSVDHPARFAHPIPSGRRAGGEIGRRTRFRS